MQLEITQVRTGNVIINQDVGHIDASAVTDLIVSCMRKYVKSPVRIKINPVGDHIAEVLHNNTIMCSIGFNIEYQ